MTYLCITNLDGDDADTTPDEDRQPWTNPYRRQSIPKGDRR